MRAIQAADQSDGNLLLPRESMGATGEQRESLRVESMEMSEDLELGDTPPDAAQLQNTRVKNQVGNMKF